MTIIYDYDLHLYHPEGNICEIKDNAIDQSTTEVSVFRSFFLWGRGFQIHRFHFFCAGVRAFKTVLLNMILFQIETTFGDFWLRLTTR